MGIKTKKITGMILRSAMLFNLISLRFEYAASGIINVIADTFYHLYYWYDDTELERGHTVIKISENRLIGL